MKNLSKILSSPIVSIIILAIYIVVLAVATFVESSYTTAVAKRLFYNSWWFFGLNILASVNFILLAVRLRLVAQKKWGVLMCHYGFVVILVGAMVTFLFSQEGLVHIRQGATSSAILDSQGKVIGKLPFEIGLDKFVLERYSGSGSPSSYESFLRIEGKPYHAYMNNVVYYRDYRLYQSSYHSDLGGTILTVNKDLVGTIITYIGYIMLLGGILLSFVHRTSRFRALLRALSVVVVLLGFGSASAQPIDKHAERLLAIDYAKRYVPVDSVAEKFGRLMVQTPLGRIEPVDTYAREVLRKISKKTHWGDLSANQVLLGILSNYGIWARVPFIKVQNDELFNILGVDKKEGSISFVDVIDEHDNYVIDSLVQATYAKAPNLRSKFDKEVLKLDEKVNILNALFQGQYLALFPKANDPSNKWYSAGDDLDDVFVGVDSTVRYFMPIFLSQMSNSYISGDWEAPSKVIDIISLYQLKKSDGSLYSSSKISAELLYNKLEIFKWSGFGYMTAGLLLIITVIVSLVTGRRLRAMFWVLFGVTILIFVAQNFAMGLRWYISERAPWTNAYETMIFVGWAAVLGGLCFVSRSKMTFALATFLGGVILFVTNLSWMDPQITPLVPVLKSYWLVVHVAVITASYGFFGIGFLLGVATLIFMAINPVRLKGQIKELCTINELALWIGLGLMTAGTFLGAVWANESWGRYWGWDPKETWALITMFVYALVLHARFVPMLRGEFKFAVMSIVALGAVLMTFFGVNYYLTGMHSYGGDSAPPALNAIWVAYGAVALLALWAWLRQRKIS